MQLNVVSIDFSPTLAEIEEANSKLRSQIYKDAVEQLAELNSAISGRNYRISMINFSGNDMDDMPRPMLAMNRGRMNKAMAMETADTAPLPSMERSEKLTVTARVVFAATPAKQ